MLAFLLIACGGSRELPVFAASSLTDVFTELERGFEREHPHIDVVLAFAGSQTLRAQIEQGAPARVFATADRSHAEQLVQAGLASAPEALATNTLVIGVPAGDPRAVGGLRGLGTVDRLVLAAPEVPAGATSATLLERAAAAWGPEWRAQVEGRVASRELSVRAVATKVALGEADAGLMYATDATSAGLTALALPADLAPEVTYWSTVVLPASDEAAAWQAWVAGPGRAVLDAHGFGVP